jgi:hypothetical protein
MKYDDLRGILRTSSAADWRSVPGPPYFVESWTGRDDLEFDGHLSWAVWRPDVSLALAWGLSGDRDLVFGWANWPDRSVSRELVDVFWNGSIVDRYYGLRVDGGRALLPQPQHEIVKDELVMPQISPTQSNVFRVLAELSQNSEYGRYLQQAGFVEIPDELD